MLTIDMARGWYDAADPVHGFDHIVRVMKLALKIASQVGADQEIVQAAALLHDAAGAEPGDGDARTRHEHDSADFAREILWGEGWDDEKIARVQHCIRAHRFRGTERPTTLEAKVLFDADKLDVVGAYGVARTLGYAMQAGQPFFAEPSARFTESHQLEKGEPHSAYHEFLFKLRQIPDVLYTAPAKEMARERHQVLCQFFEQLAREARGET